MHRPTFGTRLATAALLAPLALGLVACGGDDDARTSTSDTSDSGTSDDGGTSGDGGNTTLEGDVETAAGTALGEVEGTVFSVDGDAQGWDVTIVDADGVENDVELDPPATSVTRGPDQFAVLRGPDQSWASAAAGTALSAAAATASVASRARVRW